MVQQAAFITITKNVCIPIGIFRDGKGMRLLNPVKWNMLVVDILSALYSTKYFLNSNFKKKLFQNFPKTFVSWTLFAGTSTGISVKFMEWKGCAGLHSAVAVQHKARQSWQQCLSLGASDNVCC